MSDLAKRDETMGVELRLIEQARVKATQAERKFGPHPTADFAVARLCEEVGELSQAATAMSKGRGLNRRLRVWEEAVDTIAMVLRLVREFPEGSQPVEGFAKGGALPAVMDIGKAREIAARDINRAYAQGVRDKMEAEGVTVHGVWVGDEEVETKPRVRKFDRLTDDSGSPL